MPPKSGKKNEPDFSNEVVVSSSYTYEAYTNATFLS